MDVKKSALLALALPLSLSLSLAAGCAGGALRLSARVESVEKLKVTTMDVQLVAHVKASSPSGAGLGVSRAKVVVRSGTTTVTETEVELEPPVIVTGSRVVDVPISVSLAALVGAVPDAWSKGSVPLEVSVTLVAGELTADAGAGRVSLAMLAGASATLGELRFEGLSFGEPYLVVSIMVRNDNPGADVTVEDVVATVNLDGNAMVKDKHGEAKPTLKPDESGTVRLEVPLELAKHPDLAKKIAAGYGHLPVVADGKVVVSAGPAGRVSSDFHIEGAIELHR
jgi:hypothetical protein